MKYVTRPRNLVITDPDTGFDYAVPEPCLHDSEPKDRHGDPVMRMPEPLGFELVPPLLK